jgi:2-methylisocitrate lyase-like PEP mutase family enzyme
MLLNQMLLATATALYSISLNLWAALVLESGRQPLKVRSIAMRMTTRYRQLINRPEIAVMVGAYDALSARMVERAGFDLAFVHDFGISAGMLGMPDMGLVTLTEMTAAAANVVKTVDIPVVADGGCGFGNPLNTYRTVREYEAAGAAGVNIEDQVYPKRCGHLAGKQVITPEEMLDKIQAAIDARRDPDFVITARVDSIAIHGMDDAIRRANLYASAGADLIFIEAPTCVEDVARTIDEVDAPSWINLVEGGKTPLIPIPQLQEMGAAVVDYGPLVLFAATAGISRALDVLKRDGTTEAHLSELMTFAELNQLNRIDDYQAMEARYGVNSKSINLDSA